MDLTKAIAATARMNDGKLFPFDDETKFLVRGFQSDTYRKVVEAKTKALQTKKNPFPKLEGEQLIEAMAEGILIGWDGLKNHGEPFPYTPENAKAVLSVPLLADFVAQCANDTDAFLVEVEAAEMAALKSLPQLAP